MSSPSSKRNVSARCREVFGWDDPVRPDEVRCGDSEALCPCSKLWTGTPSPLMTLQPTSRSINQRSLRHDQFNKRSIIKLTMLAGPESVAGLREAKSCSFAAVVGFFHEKTAVRTVLSAGPLLSLRLALPWRVIYEATSMIDFSSGPSAKRRRRRSITIAKSG